MIVAEGFPISRKEAAPAMLQWGRNMIVAEGHKGHGPQPQTNELQWGRNMIVAEGETIRTLDTNTARFNGAAT